MPTYTGKRVTVIKLRRSTTGSSPSDSFGGAGSTLEGTVTASDTVGLEIQRSGSNTTIFVPWTSIDHLVIGDQEPQDV